MSTRHRVLSREVSLEEIFPRDRPWRTLFSIHVLSSHLHECNKLGVADKGFILHGSKVLSDLLLDSSRPVSGVILRKCLPSLVGFLQGETQQPKTSTSLHLANDLLERPHDSPPPPYIEDSARLGFRLFEIIEEIDSFTPSTPMLSSQPVAVSCRAELKKLTYSVMLQLARTDGLWPAIENTSFFVSAHRGMLLNEDASVSQTMSSFMTDFLKEQPKLATRSYLRTLLALMPDAMGCQRSTAGFFTLFREVLLVDGRAGDSDQNIRSIIEKLVQHVWLYQHTETADNAVVDPTLLNLLNLLNSAIDVLRSFKQPLALGSLAMDIYSGLLFCDESQSPEADLLTTDIDESAKPSLTLRANPIHADDATSLLEPADTILPHHLSPLGSSRPLYNTISRTVCMEIVRKLCDNSVTLAWLTDCLSSVTQQAAQCPVNAFPTGHFIRAPDAGAGLTNLGMTCYMNSLLQQIYANIQLRKFVFDTPVANPSEPDLLWHVKRLFAEMQDSNTPCVDTQALARYLNISVENQEDVHGFYTIFMSALEQCLPNPAATAAFNSMFSGKLVTQIQGSCGHVSSRTEPFSDLSITVQNKTSLAESLEEFVQGEPMQGANKYKCLSCDAESGGKLVDAMRRTCLDTVPDHLTVCLKRFTFDMLGQESKNNDYFQFPEEFDLSEFKRESLEHPDKPAQPDMFKLVGVIVHSGILTFGHYWSYVRLRYPDHHFSRWARLEDSNYRSAQGFDEVQNECYGGAKGTHNGYVLFYQRESAFDMARSATLPQNAQSSYNMPPRVQVPNDLYQEIHQQNVERHRTAQPFDESFHKLVLDVIQEFHLRSADAIEDITSPQSPDVTSPDMNQMAMMHSHASVARLGLNYINHVLFSEKIPGKVRQFDNAFIQVVRNVMSARFFIMEASRNPGVLLRLIDHDELASRNIIKTLFRRCLEIIREGDPDKYDFYFKQFVNAHASMLSEMGPRYYRWLDYFAMAFDLKMLGRFEATVVLNAGYIPWILETAMDAPLDPSAHPDQQALVTAWRKGRVSYLPLLQFLQLFMVQGGAFNEPDSYDTFRDHGEFAAAMGLFEHKAPGECALLRWMLIASMSETDASTWRSFAPAVLVQAMAESPDERVSTIVGNSLWACFNQNQVFKPALSLMAIAYIIGCKDKNLDMVQTVLEAMFECIRLSKRMPCRAGLDILDAVMPWAPISTLYSIDYCLPEFLLPGNKVTKRTHQWLTLNVFAPDPLSKVSEEPEIWGTALDVARAQSVRGLYRTCNEFLINAHDVDDTPVYHVMQTTFSDAANYLARLITMCSEVEHTSLGLRQLAERGARDRADAEGEATDMTTPGTLDIPELSEEMAKEYPLALDTRQRLLALLQTMQRWADDQELMEEEDSSAFDDTEDDEV
jgi:ubiquitin carboxyl-terminal hydrolase 34